MDCIISEEFGGTSINTISKQAPYRFTDEEPTRIDVIRISLGSVLRLKAWRMVLLSLFLVVARMLMILNPNSAKNAST